MIFISNERKLLFYWARIFCAMNAERCSLSLFFSLERFHLHAQLVGHNGIQQDAHDGCDGQTRQMDGT